MDIPLGSWFLLPRLGSEAFRGLVRNARVEYDKARGFRTTALTDLYLVSSILKGALGEDIVFTVKCFICGEDAGCSICEFRSVCDRRIISQACICKECSSKPEAFNLYSMRFAEISA